MQIVQLQPVNHVPNSSVLVEDVANRYKTWSHHVSPTPRVPGGAVPLAARRGTERRTAGLRLANFWSPDANSHTWNVLSVCRGRGIYFESI